ncbi:FG-GAP repeat domain-containing protein [Ulvibacterium marinum]|uniref:FG-GAP repeat domain-containing protein n=1 Tax=Ulvibacterium marinum TaxID=2419782 RepID=UPI00249410F1|nr:VCBS repeat-containing protein [Ulvibacterium marinum]
MKNKLIVLTLLLIQLFSCDRESLEGDYVQESFSKKTTLLAPNVSLNDADYTVGSNSLATLKNAVENSTDINGDGKIIIIITSDIEINTTNYNLLPITVDKSMEVYGLGNQDAFVKGEQVPVIAHKAPYKYTQPNFSAIFSVNSQAPVLFYGLKFKGPLAYIDESLKSTDADEERSRAIYANRKVNIEHCEFYYWNIAIQLSGADSSQISNSYIHYNSMHEFTQKSNYGFGYGVYISGNTRDIEINGNVFWGNKHAVASDGFDASSYSARYNVITRKSYGTIFDVHSSTGETPGNNGVAGKSLLVDNNIWYDIMPPPDFPIPINVRGVPVETNTISNNYFDNCHKFYPHSNNESENFHPCFLQNKNDLDYERIDVNNVYANNYVQIDFGSAIKTTDFLLGNFDADPQDEILYSDGKAWYIADHPNENPFSKNILGNGSQYPNYISSTKTLSTYVSDLGNHLVWKFLTKSDFPVSELRVGDFNGDGIDDLFHIHDQHWNYYDTGSAQWRVLKSQSYSLEKMIFGDIDGNGKTDVLCLSVGDSKFYPYMNGISYMGNSIPVPSTASAQDYVICDFDSDVMSDDIFNIHGGNWNYYDISDQQWNILKNQSYSIDKMIFGDIDGDGQTDILCLSIGDNKIFPYMDGISYTGNSILVSGEQSADDFLLGNLDDGISSNDLFSVNSGIWNFYSGETDSWFK